MLRRRIAVIAVVTMVSGLLSPAPAQAVTVEVRGMSHRHPEERNFSWVGVRVKASRRAMVEVHLAGPSVISANPVSCRAPGKRAPRKKRGKVLAVFKIDQVGQYTTHVTATKSGDSATAQDNYMVPSPDGKKWGPFRFRDDAGCYGGWPED